MRSLPTSLCLSHKPLYLGLHRSPSSTLPAFHSNFGVPLRPSIHCNAQEESETMVQDEKHHKEVTTNPSWSTPASPAPVPPASHSPDRYAGWSPVDANSEGSWKAGLFFSREPWYDVVWRCFASFPSYYGCFPYVAIPALLLLNDIETGEWGWYFGGLVAKVNASEITRFRLLYE